MLTRETVARVMQVSALLMFVLAMGIGLKMVTEQGPAHAPARAELRESLRDLRSELEMTNLSAAAEDNEGGDRMMGEMMSEHNDLVSITNATARVIMAEVGVNRNEGQRKGSRVAHAHGNLESLWVLAASLVLIRLAVPFWLTSLTGLAFIVGSWLHGGAFVLMQYGVNMRPLLETGLGPIGLIGGTLLLLISILWHWRMNGAAES